jgi:hypothetical protein
MMLGFKARFEKKILSKEKRHSIRAKRKGRQWRVGDRCDCYVNPRQKSMRLLGRWRCVKLQDIRIEAKTHQATTFLFIWIDGQGPLTKDEAELLARADGFKDLYEMADFWSGRLPFHGDIIHWNPDVPIAIRRKRLAQRA